MYKFEVYRNPNNPLATSNYDDNSYRYFESLYLFEREIKPTWNNLSFDDKKDNGRFFFRTHLGGEFTLSNADFDWAESIRVDSNEINIYRILLIKELVDGSWETKWKGFLSIADGDFNLDRCSVEFSDLLVFDKYSIILENKDKEFNLIEIPAIPVNYERHTYSYEVDVSSSEILWGIVCIPTNHPYFCDVDASEHYITDDDKWTLVKKSTSYAGQGWSANGLVWSWKYNVTLEYRRDVLYADAAPTADWVLITTGTGGALNTYARHYKGMDSLSFTQVKLSRNIKNEETGDYCKFMYASNDVNLPADLYYENSRARSFSSVIYHMLNNFPTIDGYESLFFEGVTNPITGATNRLNLLTVFQLSDMKVTSDAATIGMYTFGDFENWIAMFCCGWYIDDDNNFIVEHEKYFDLGLSYTESVIGLDISSYNSTLGKMELSYSSDLPHMDKLEFGYSGNQDFIGLPIYYHGNLVNRREDESVNTVSINDVSTDLTYITAHEDSIGNDGFFMAATYINDDGEIWVRKTNGAITTQLLWNADLSTANLMRDYWVWGRSQIKGVVNNVLKDLNQKNIVIQADLAITNCDDYDQYKLVKTRYGNGKIETASKSLKDKRLTLSLSYDT